VTEAEANHCIDCGRVASGLRCKDCHGKFIARQALLETAKRDAAVLQMVGEEHLSGQRLADRLGVSRTRARQLIRAAERRTERRNELVP
jgi:hypothetical protein